MSNRKTVALSLLLAAGVVAALVLAGCSTVSSAISNAVAPKPAPAAEAQQPAEQPAAQPQAQPSGATMAYKYQFNAFYGAMWNFGWFGYKDANYKEGQGTVWEITGSRGSKGPTTFERAFLKVTPDKSQWWRFKIQDKKNEIVYEFLVASDTTVQKVRFKDPDSGQVQEFVPDKSGPQPTYTATQPTREQLANSLVGKENVTVKAGSFSTDHYRYTEPKSGYTGDSWISKTVPGYMVKFSGKNPKNNDTASGELVQIENGVTTVLGSF